MAAPALLATLQFAVCERLAAGEWLRAPTPATKRPVTQPLAGVSLAADRGRHQLGLGPIENNTAKCPPPIAFSPKLCLARPANRCRHRGQLSATIALLWLSPKGHAPFRPLLLVGYLLLSLGARQMAPAGRSKWPGRLAR